MTLAPLRCRLAFALPAVVLAGVLLVLGPAGAATSGSPSPRSVAVDPALETQVDANPTGGVDAVVTAWNPAGLDAIERLGVTGTRLRTLPMILTTGLTADRLQALRASPHVRSIWANTRHTILMEDSTWITRARYVWATSNGSGGLPGYGVTGRGVEIAEIDTGVDAGHEDADNVVEFCEAAAAATGSRMQVACTPHRAGTGNLPYATGTNPRVDCALPGTCDEGSGQGHGSHVAGTIAGTGHASGGTQNTHSTIGMAPHAKLRVYSANVATALLNFQILASYDDLTWKKENGFNEVVAVSNSWGGGDGLNYAPGDPINVAVKRAFNAGILSVFAAGNSGWEHDTLSRQCVNPFVVCVAASTKPDSVVMFSSRGRPSQPWDTNRDGVIDAADVPPDNHDRRLGQALELGLYRPTLTAPGANINSIQANAPHPDCREDILISTPSVPGKDCYDSFNGTSMATPHVSGAVALIVQAYRQEHDGDTPTPNQITDILERSANVTKLPGWEAEEQGAGRLDALEAVKFARSHPNGLRRANFGMPTAPFVQGDYPRGPELADYVEPGCTSPLSWTYGDLEGPAPFPVVPSPGYGQHFIDVPPKTERLRVTVRWGQYHPETNLYVRMWRPGVNPDADANPAGPTRTYPDQESLNLLGDLGPFLGPERLMEVRAPEEANPAEGGSPPAIPSGRWVMRVYHRVSSPTDPPQAVCAGNENPKRTPAYRYDLHVEIATVTHAPTVSITSPAENAQTSGRWVDVRGRAGYPPPDTPRVGNVGHSWEGITNWAVPNSNRTTSGEHADPNPANPRAVLYFHGNAHDVGDPSETSCVGDGKADNLSSLCNGPKLLSSSTLSNNPLGAASWKGDPSDWTFTGASPGGDRLPIDPNWVWCVSATPTLDCPIRDPAAPAPPVSIGGAMTVEWWASCSPLCVGGGPEWYIRLWVDGVLIVEEEVSVGPNLPLIADRLRATINVPQAIANERITLHVEPVFLFNQFLPFFIYYDHVNPCTPTASGPCDSLVRMPVGSSGAGGGGTGPAPENIRVTDLPGNPRWPAAPLSQALRVAWDPVPGATGYEVYRSTDPTVLGTRVFSGAGTPCISPRAPGDAPPGHDRSGLCFTNTSGLSFLTTYYYRVFAFNSSGQRSVLSEVAYGAPTRYDRQVRLKVDRLYGPQHWEHALQPPSPTPSDTTNTGVDWRYLWDTLELTSGQHPLFARSFTQGIGSAKAKRTVRDDGTSPPPPPPNGGCPDDDDGDGDDDEHDGDHDDDGDDRDDDCEDDDDDEEEDDD
jgi:serine protease AprX